MKSLAVLALIVTCVSVGGPAMGQRALEPSTSSRAPNGMLPQWSHDSRRIVFTMDVEGDPEIYVVNADGTSPARLTQAPGRDAHPFLSRDGKRMFFQSPRANGKDTNLYVQNLDGSGLKQLTELRGFAGVPVLSPDEKRVAFQWRPSNDFKDSTKWKICVMNADGSDMRVVTSGAANDQVPNWSRDGRLLLFFSDRTGRNQIYTMRSDGTNVRRVADTKHADSTAFWSPDNSKIAFTSDRDGNSEIYVMDANGRNVRRLTNTPAIERTAVWSPDGARIVFSSDVDGRSDVYTMRPDGTDVVRLTGGSG